MSQESIAYLLGFFQKQKQVINELMSDLHKKLARGKTRDIYYGYLLHNVYSAIEDVFQEIAKTFENQIQDPSRYHRELLIRMTIEVPGIRLAFLSEESLDILDELRGFRHIFRHSYSYELDPIKVKALRSKILKGIPTLFQDWQNFENFLRNQLDNSNDEC